MPYQIHPAQPSHLPHLSAISRAAAELFPEADLPIELRAHTTPLEDLRESLQEKKLWVAVFEPEDKVVGFARLIDRCGQIHLREVDVHPAHGRRGVGTRLLQTAIGWAQQAGYDRMTLTTFRHLRWNAPFYAKLGFQATEPSERSPCLKALLEEEAKGVDIAKRVLMSLELKSRTKVKQW